MQPDLAVKRSAAVNGIASSAARQAAILWRKQMGPDFDSGWLSLGPSVTALTATAQTAVAAGASPYLTRTASADGLDAGSGGDVLPSAFAGVDASGRTLDGLLYGAVTTSKQLIGRGADVRTALQAGQVYLSTMVQTATLDTARSSNVTAMTAHRYTHYVREITAGACSRCAMLAGISSARTPFQRHPGCKCLSVPVTGEDRSGGRPLGRFDSPQAYFDSMTAAEQDRIFTRAGAEAIRAGADPVRVVTARRGAPGIGYSKTNRTVVNSGRRLERVVIGQRPDGTPILGYVTSEGTTARSAQNARQRIVGAGRQAGTRFAADRRIRLMPETIIGLTDDVALRQVLLRDAGYLDVPATLGERREAGAAGFLDRRAEIIREDRRTADAFYREHGIRLG